ncbi:restriction endonuclease subunit S [Aliarcobacter cryaerophilus]|uniref:restriction endonuclease subunit S n=1 Tax=Aliarcobacter cryaerophilus TaxID=28198 RepID=UPI000824CFEC|nr:restriction endonuclease subunit S [Aliarcobacter cryaerophilus]
MAKLYSLPNGWEWKKLGDVCNLLNGYAFKAKDYVEFSDTVLIRMGNIRPNGEFDAEHKIQYLPNKYSSELTNYILNDGDLIIAMTDMATEMKILGIPTLVKNTSSRIFMLNQRVGKLYDFKLDKINIEYLKYILSANQIKDYYKSLGGGGLQINIGKQQILSVDFPLPPLEEQKRIVAKLDILFAKIDKAIALHQKNIDEADIFMASVLNDVFVELEEKYEKIPLFDVADVNRGKSKHRPRNDKKLFGGNYPFIQTGDVRNANKYIDTFSETYSEFGLSQSKLWKKDTICMTIAANIGDVAILNIDSCFPDSVVGIYSENNSNDFLYYFLLTLKQQLESQATTTAQMNINLKILQTIGVPLPPLKTQQKVVSYLDEISNKMEKIKNLQKKKMQSLKELKASILDQAFKGEL